MKLNDWLASVGEFFESYTDLGKVEAIEEAIDIIKRYQVREKQVRDVLADGSWDDWLASGEVDMTVYRVLILRKLLLSQRSTYENTEGEIEI